MQRLLAAVLMFCFGIMLPLAASPVRMCLMEGTIHVPGFPAIGVADTHGDACCPDCGNHDQPCCAELQKLPDSTLPATFPDLPPLVGIDLPGVWFLAPLEPVVLDPAFHPSVPIRGPDTPSEHRAVLAIWRI